MVGKWRYSVSTLDFPAGMEADSHVHRHLGEWAEAGWELMSGTATAYVPWQGTSSVPHIKYVAYWRRPIEQDADGDESPAREADPGVAGAGRSSAPYEPPREATFDVVITSGGARRVEVMKAVRDITGWEIQEAKDFVDVVPKTLAQGVSGSTAEALTARLEAAGATVEVRNSY